MKGPYLFTSERLGFRNWREGDIDLMAAINADPRVMEFFPATQDRVKTAAFVERMQTQFNVNGYCYFAVEETSTKDLTGFIGLSEQTFPAAFTPCIDIGWRLGRKHWGRGFATEGARRCITHAFNDLGISTVHAMAPKANFRSENVMKKLGMEKVLEFIHPVLEDDARLRDCVLYRAEKSRR